MVYLLNLTFDLQSAAAATGIFNDGTSNPPDQSSKVWFTAPAGWPTTMPPPSSPLNQAVFNLPNAPNQPDSNELGLDVGDNLFIRVAARNWSQGPTAIALCVTFARTEPTLASLASPFTSSLVGGRPQTIWNFSMSSGFQGSLIYYLGPIVNIGDPGTGDGGDYTFIVTAQASDQNGNAVQYGHDPRIIVGGGGGI
jgi:hypothetical protein